LQHVRLFSWNAMNSNNKLIDIIRLMCYNKSIISDKSVVTISNNDTYRR